MKAFLRALVWLFLFTLLVVGSAAGYLYREYQSFLQQPLTIPDSGVEVLISKGSAYPSIIRQLEAAGMTRSSWHWRLLGRLRSDSPEGRYQAGEYRFLPGLNPSQVLDRIAAGDVVHYSFTIIEGWTVRQMRLALAELPRLERVTGNWSEAELADALGIVTQHPDANILEGWFLPASYDYHRGHTDLDILRRAHRAMQQALEQSWQQRAGDLPYQNPYELLTMASIVEKETGLPDERDQVAGVFVRRLHKGMRLQTDPTIIYGLGAAFDGNLKRIHLRTDGPYNSYTRHGLPPSPIALPGVEALEAAAHPADGTALYFVATGDGGHVFSSTLAEHERNVDRYQRKRKPKSK